MNQNLVCNLIPCITLIRADDTGPDYDLILLGAGKFQWHSAVTQHPIQWIPGALSLRVERPGREADHWLPSSAEVEECVGLCLNSPNTPSWRGAQLRKAQRFYLYLYLTGGMIRGSSPDKGWKLMSSPPRPDRLCNTPSLLSNGYQGLFPWG
jgi:hypothetical protein